MISKPLCTRCGETAESYNYKADSTFWGFYDTATETVTSRIVRVRSTYFRRSGNRSPLVVDEKNPLCADCWAGLVDFLNGRATPAVDKTAQKK